MENIKIVLYDNSKTLLVVFTSIGSKPDEFSFFKTINSLGNSAIFIRNTKDDWYVNGIDCLADNVIDTTSILSGIINDIVINSNIEDVIFIGSSMGAYGAVRCTENISISVLYSYVLFSLESPLLLSNSKSILNKTDLDVSSGTDIIHLLTDKKGVLFFGEYDLVDSYTALRVKEQKSNIKVVSHKSSGHNVPEKLNEDWSIVNYFHNFISGDFRITNSGGMANFLSSGDLLLFSMMVDKDMLDVKFLHILVDKYPDYGFALNRLGVIYHQKNDYKNALKFIKRSLAVNHKFDNSKQHYKLLTEKIRNNATSE
ncbi:tetratricopeptide repeat protein [Vibrio hyugaensis]|uniref:tetratricopeptide repeat protein n=1 Tax=Vibrio hyugaensis TaxID=1534743 RepID=UPI0005EF1B41|nr:tetratricopeptide repeat protein [Vibrio hyugaensis]